MIIMIIGLNQFKAWILSCVSGVTIEPSLDFVSPGDDMNISQQLGLVTELFFCSKAGKNKSKLKN